jgi:hypothetical protein
MPRSCRLDIIGVVQHGTLRGIEGRLVFRDERDREEFVRRIGGVVGAGKAQLLAKIVRTTDGARGSPG